MERAQWGSVFGGCFFFAFSCKDPRRIPRRFQKKNGHAIWDAAIVTPPRMQVLFLFVTTTDDLTT